MRHTERVRDGQDAQCDGILEGECCVTTSNSLVVKHHSLVAAKLEFLNKAAPRQD